MKNWEPSVKAEGVILENWVVRAGPNLMTRSGGRGCAERDLNGEKSLEWFASLEPLSPDAVPCYSVTGGFMMC